MRTTQKHLDYKIGELNRRIPLTGYRFDVDHSTAGYSLVLIDESCGGERDLCPPVTKNALAVILGAIIRILEIQVMGGN